MTQPSPPKAALRRTTERQEHLSLCSAGYCFISPYNALRYYFHHLCPSVSGDRFVFCCLHWSIFFFLWTSRLPPYLFFFLSVSTPVLRRGGARISCPVMFTALLVFFPSILISYGGRLLCCLFCSSWSGEAAVFARRLFSCVGHCLLCVNTALSLCGSLSFFFYSISLTSLRPVFLFRS